MLINHHKDNEITFLIIFQQFKHHHMKRWSYATAIMHCIGKAASAVKEFYMLPVGDKLTAEHKNR